MKEVIKKTKKVSFEGCADHSLATLLLCQRSSGRKKSKINGRKGKKISFKGHSQNGGWCLSDTRMAHSFIEKSES